MISDNYDRGHQVIDTASFDMANQNHHRSFSQVLFQIILVTTLLLSNRYWFLAYRQIYIYK